MHASETLEPLIDKLYEAAFDAGKWPPFLTALARTLEGTLPTLFLHDPRTHAGSLAINVGFDEAMVRAYKERLGERNIWLRSGAHLLATHQVRISHMMCSRKTLLGSEWYADYCLPLGISQAIGATIDKSSVVTSNIAIMGPAGRPDFDRDDMALLEALMPHLQRALRVHTHMADSDLRQRELTDALEHMTVGVIMVTKSARVLFMNRTARSIVSRRDGLHVDATGLRALRLCDTATLRAHIAGAAERTAGRGTLAGGEFRLPRPFGRAALEIVVSPISVEQTWCSGEQAVAAVYITDPGQIPQRPEAIMSRIYGLTPAEAKVAALIARGLTGRQAADKLEVSHNTLKTHLKRVFAKTETNNQGALIRLLVAGAGRVDLPADGPQQDRRLHPRT
jgi:DNA-binding CsgD family transcriptional regulator/PAS domain-containing protein